MQSNQSSPWLWIILPAVLATIGGALVVGDFSPSSSISPVDILMRVERFYREDLVNKYATLEMSDKELADASESIANFLSRHKETLTKLEEDVEPEMVELVSNFNSHISLIVDSTKVAFKTLYETRLMVESNPELRDELSRLGILADVERILHTPMNEVKINNYAELLEITTNRIRYAWESQSRPVYIRQGLNPPKTVGTLLQTLHARLWNVQVHLVDMYKASIELDELCSKYLRQRCTQALYEFTEVHRTSVATASINLPAFFSDVAALIHKYVEVLGTVKPAEKVKVGNITIRFSKESDSTLLDVVKDWASTVALLDKSKWTLPDRDRWRYYLVDLQMMSAYVAKNHAWIRLGQPPGHVARIEKEDGAFTVRYYDKDASVNHLLVELIGEYVPSAQVTVLNDGVEIKVNNEYDLRKIAKLLALVPSLDLRIRVEGYVAVKRSIRTAIRKLKLLQ